MHARALMSVAGYLSMLSALKQVFDAPMLLAALTLWTTGINNKRLLPTFAHE